MASPPGEDTRHTKLHLSGPPRDSSAWCSQAWPRARRQQLPPSLPPWAAFGPLPGTAVPHQRVGGGPAWASLLWLLTAIFKSLEPPQETAAESSPMATGVPNLSDKVPPGDQGLSTRPSHFFRGPLAQLHTVAMPRPLSSSAEESPQVTQTP